MGTVEVLPRTRKSKKTTKKPTTAKPTSSPTSSPTVLTALKIINQTVSTLLPKGATELEDPIAKWYYYDMRPTDLSGATARFVNLTTEVSDSGRNVTLKTGAPDDITSALRLHTRDVNNDKAEVGIKFYDGAANKGLFNGMSFKEMVTGGISFEYSFFKAANVLFNSLAPAPAIKMAVYSPSTTNFTTFVWEPYVGGLVSGSPAIDSWIYNLVNTTTGTSTPTGGGGKGWTQTRWGPGNPPPSADWLNYRGNLAAWAAYFDTYTWTGANPMGDAIVTSVSIGLGSYNPSVTSYVNSLRIFVGDYDWKWNFGS
jgi:hypothetical protein